MWSNKLFLSLILASSVSQAQSTSFEERMHTIYKSSYSEEVSDDFWMEYIQSINTRSYVVRSGDTLWDLSTVFFGDGNYWSKIWSYNAEITNPHFIKVGQKIRFFTGTVDEPPGVEMEEKTPLDSRGVEKMVDPVLENLPKGFVPVKTEEVTEVEEEADPEVTQAEGGGPVKKMTSGRTKKVRAKRVGGLYPGAPAIPPPKHLSKPPRPLPNSFAESFGYNVQEYNERGLSFDLRPPIRVNPRFDAGFFVFDQRSKKYPRIGKIIESETGNVLLGLSDKVYVESEKDLQVGDVLTVMGQEYILDRNDAWGSVIRYLAKLHVTEKMENNRYRTEVARSMGGIRPGAWISDEEVPDFGDDYKGRPSSVAIPVVGGGADNKTRIFGQSDFIFLKRTKRDQQVRVGDILGIYKRRKTRLSNAQVERSPTPIGHVKVTRVFGKLVTAFVLESQESIYTGDETGAPTKVVSTITESEKEDLNSLEDGLDFATGPAAPEASGTMEEEIQDDAEFDEEFSEDESLEDELESELE